MVANVESRQCNDCLQTKTLDHFHKDPHGPDGYREQCAECRQKQREIDKLKETAAVTQLIIQNQGLAALENLSKMPNGAGVPGADEIYERIIGGFGGPNGYIKMLLADYYAAKPGSKERMKFHEQVQRLLLRLDISKPKLEDLSTEDLEDLVERVFNKVSASKDEQKKIVDGKIAEYKEAIDADPNDRGEASE